MDNQHRLLNRHIVHIEVNEEKNKLVFVFLDGVERLRVEADCCSRSWIEYITVPDDAIGSIIIEIEDSGRVSEKDEEECYLLQVYQTTFKTPKGDIVLEFRNESNGYYGGSLAFDDGDNE